MNILSKAGYEHEGPGPFLFESCKNLRNFAITHYKGLYKKVVKVKKIKIITKVRELEYPSVYGDSLLRFHFERSEPFKLSDILLFKEAAGPECIIEEFKYSLAENDIEIFKPEFMKSLKKLRQLKQIHYTNVRYLYDFGQFTPDNVPNLIIETTSEKLLIHDSYEIGMQPFKVKCLRIMIEKWNHFKQILTAVQPTRRLILDLYNKSHHDFEELGAILKTLQLNSDTIELQVITDMSIEVTKQDYIKFMRLPFHQKSLYASQFSSEMILDQPQVALQEYIDMNKYQKVNYLTIFKDSLLIKNPCCIFNLPIKRKCFIIKWITEPKQVLDFCSTLQGFKSYSTQFVRMSAKDELFFGGILLQVCEACSGGLR